MKAAKKEICSVRKLQGVSMLEILVALLITTVGLLGFASLQSRALLSTEDTYQRTQATSFAQDIIERMRMNGMTPAEQSNAAGTVASAAYTTASNWTGALPTAACLGMSQNCSKDVMAQYDIAQIRTAVQAPSNLPNGSALVATCANNRVCAYVAWGDKTAAECAAAGGVGIQTCVVIQGN